jgi:hypothetical protein
MLLSMPCGDLVEFAIDPSVDGSCSLVVDTLVSTSLVASRRVCYSRPSSGRLVSACLVAVACVSLAIDVPLAVDLSKESSSLLTSWRTNDLSS